MAFLAAIADLGGEAPLDQRQSAMNAGTREPPTNPGRFRGRGPSDPAIWATDGGQILFLI